MLVIGIAGGIACGKSLIALQFERLGAVVVDVDRLGHEVLREPPVLEAIRKHWGDGVFNEEGAVDRQALAAIVFAKTHDGQEAPLKKLEQMTHPRISELLKQQLAQFRKQGVKAAVVDAPVMFKAGWDKFCDKIVFVDAPVEVRIQRVTQYRNWPQGELHRRELRQLPLDEKRKRATNFIDNSGTKEQTILQVNDIWRAWGLPLPAQLNDLPNSDSIQ